MKIGLILAHVLITVVIGLYVGTYAAIHETTAQKEAINKLIWEMDKRVRECRCTK